MKKKVIVILGVALVLVIAAVFLLRGGEVSVVSNPDDNSIVLTAKGSGFSQKVTGHITAAAIESICVEYALEKGSMDVAFDIPGDDFYSVSDLKGNGVEEFEKMQGEYTVIFTLHGVTGEARVYIKN